MQGRRFLCRFYFKFLLFSILWFSLFAHIRSRDLGDFCRILCRKFFFGRDGKQREFVIIRYHMQYFSQEISFLVLTKRTSS